MPSIQDWSTVADANTSVGGVDIFEGTAPPANINNGVRNVMAQVQAYRLDTGGAVATGGTAAAYTFASRGSVAAFQNGARISFRAHASNTAAPTLAVGSLGAKALRKVTAAGDVALDANDILAGGHYTVEYDTAADSTAGAWVLLGAAAQPLDPDLTAIAALSTTAAGRSILTFADPDADRLFGWDDSAATAIGFTLGTGLSFSGTSVALDATLVSLSGLTIASGSVPVGSGSDTFSAVATSAAGRSLWNYSGPGADRVLVWDHSASAMAGFTVGTGLSFNDGSIDTSSLLASLSGLSMGIGSVPIGETLASFTTAASTAAGRTLWNFTDPGADQLIFWDDSATALTGLTLPTGLSISGTALTFGAALAAVAAQTPAADRYVYYTSSSAASLGTITTFGRSLIDDSNAAGAKTTLGLGTAADLDVGTSGSTIPKNDTANTFSAAQAITLSAAGAALTITSSDASATGGPNLHLVRSSASPAASDGIGAIILRGQDSGGNDTQYGTITGLIVDPTNGSEDGEIVIQTIVAGATTNTMSIFNGVLIGAPTGGFKGAGALNAVAVYDDNVLLTDYVFDKLLGDGGAYSPRVRERFDALDPSMFEPASYTRYWKDHRRLYGHADLADVVDGVVKEPLGTVSQRLWQTAELHAIHTDRLLQRIDALETRLAALEAGRR